MGRESWKSAFQHGELLSWLRACCETITSHKVTSQLSSTQKKRMLQVSLHSLVQKGALLIHYWRTVLPLKFNSNFSVASCTIWICLITGEGFKIQAIWGNYFLQEFNNCSWGCFTYNLLVFIKQTDFCLGFFIQAMLRYLNHSQPRSLWDILNTLRQPVIFTLAMARKARGGRAGNLQANRALRSL